MCYTVFLIKWECFFFLYILNTFLGIMQLNNLELAVNLAKRGNLPGAEELVTCLLYFSFHVYCLIDCTCPQSVSVVLFRIEN